MNNRRLVVTVGVASGIGCVILAAGGPGVARSAQLLEAAGPLATATRIPVTDVLSRGCVEGNPFLATTRFFRYDAAADSGVILAVRDTAGEAFEYPDNPRNLVLARLASVGAVYGLAYDPGRNHIYVSAHNTADTAFGPRGPGGIYQLDLGAGTITASAAIPAGQDMHAYDSPNDAMDIPWLGRSSLGDLDVDLDGNRLFVMNLYDRRIHVMSIPELTELYQLDNGAGITPWSANARPFALGYHDGHLFHGVVDSRENRSLPGELSAHVYRSRPDGSELAEVLSFKLDYPRSPKWVPWDDTPEWTRRPTGSQPLLADIEFERNGGLILGLANRQFWYFSGLAGHGDMLAAERKEAAAWELLPDWDHYADDQHPPNEDTIEEPLLGALAVMPGGDNVVVTATRYLAGGLQWYANGSGALSGPSDGFESVFGDQPGLGDIELLCRAIPTPTITSTVATTATTTPPTPTLTPSPEVASPTPTSSGDETKIYLPVTTNRECVIKFGADVVLVVDVSSSMMHLSTAGRPKIAAVEEAVWALIDGLDLSGGTGSDGDRVAIVGFNASAWVEQRLTTDRTALVSSMNGIRARMAEGTRLDLALQESSRALNVSNGNRRSIVVLLTDGLPNGVPTPPPTGTEEDTVVATANALKAEGVLLFVVGVGQDDAVDPADRINSALLRAVASMPSTFYRTPDAEQLLEIYGRIARAIPCARRRTAAQKGARIGVSSSNRPAPASPNPLSHRRLQALLAERLLQRL